ncbi:MAG: flagellar export protein FliJ [Acidaminobacteraceae bacterium]
MAGFNFRYDSILKMRVDAEEEKKNIVSRLNSELSILENNLQNAYNNKQKHIEEFELMLTNGCKGYELSFIQQANNFHEENIKKIKLKIKEKKFEVEDAYKIYIEAAKERKIMEKLKEKKEEEFIEVFNKKEEKTMEEIVNYKNFKMSGD